MFSVFGKVKLTYTDLWPLIFIFQRLVQAKMLSIDSSKLSNRSDDDKYDEKHKEKNKKKKTVFEITEKILERYKEIKQRYRLRTLYIVRDSYGRPSLSFVSPAPITLSVETTVDGGGYRSRY